MDIEWDRAKGLLRLRAVDRALANPLWDIGAGKMPIAGSICIRTRQCGGSGASNPPGWSILPLRGIFSARDGDNE
jgi:hypothetical protein